MTFRDRLEKVIKFPPVLGRALQYWADTYRLGTLEAAMLEGTGGETTQS